MLVLTNIFGNQFKCPFCNASHILEPPLKYNERRVTECDNCGNVIHAQNQYEVGRFEKEPVPTPKTPSIKDGLLDVEWEKKPELPPSAKSELIVNIVKDFDKYKELLQNNINESHKKKIIPRLITVTSILYIQYDYNTILKQYYINIRYKGTSEINPKEHEYACTYWL